MLDKALTVTHGAAAQCWKFMPSGTGFFGCPNSRHSLRMATVGISIDKERGGPVSGIASLFLSAVS
jgi:hypothetical protein